MKSPFRVGLLFRQISDHRSRRGCRQSGNSPLIWKDRKSLRRSPVKAEISNAPKEMAHASGRVCRVCRAARAHGSSLAFFNLRRPESRPSASLLTTACPSEGRHPNSVTAPGASDLFFTCSQVKSAFSSMPPNCQVHWVVAQRGPPSSQPQ